VVVYSLDTNICIGLLKGEPELKERLADLSQPQLKVCSVVRAELYFGARKSSRIEQNMIGHRRFLETFETLAFDDVAAEFYGTIRADLERAGTPIGNNDMLIAAIARANNCIMVTRNQREFVRVAGLQVEVW
jgi:tRNA(fMet)-specific endonuclease VapC